jgi:hypothetical protein
MTIVPPPLQWMRILPPPISTPASPGLGAPTQSSPKMLPTECEIWETEVKTTAPITSIRITTNAAIPAPHPVPEPDRPLLARFVTGMFPVVCGLGVGRWDLARARLQEAVLPELAVAVRAGLRVGAPAEPGGAEAARVSGVASALPHLRP